MGLQLSPVNSNIGVAITQAAKSQHAPLPGKGLLPRRIVNFFGEDEDCELLPETPPEEDEPPLELFDLLTRGSEFLRNYTEYNEALMLLGNTGAGKSTATQMIAGNMSKLYSVLARGDRFVIIDEDNKIGAPSTRSKTLIPELFIKPGNESIGEEPLPFFDCPGFDDTRGPVTDIAANFFMNEIAAKISNLKMLFLVIHSSVKLGNDRIDFDKLTTRAATFVKYMMKYKDSISLVVTKVDSYSGAGRYIKDETIIEGIVEFLESYNRTLYTELGTGDPVKDNLTQNKITFVETFLEQDPVTGNYSKIWFIRSPTDCGRLSEIEMYQEMKVKVIKMYEKLTFTPVNSKVDFGFPVQDETKLAIKRYVNDINKAIVNAVGKITEDLKNVFSRHFASVRPEGLNLTKFMGPLEETNRNMKLLMNNIDTLKLSSNTSNPLHLLRAMVKFWDSEGHPLSAQFQDFLYWQETYLNFFDLATGERERRDVKDWVDSLEDFQTNFARIFDWYQFCRDVEKEVLSHRFQKTTRPKLPPPPTNGNWTHFIDANGIIPVSQRIKDIANEFKQGDPEPAVLSSIMEYIMEKSKTEVTCANGVAKIVHKDSFIFTQI